MRHERIVAEGGTITTSVQAADLLAASFGGLAVEELRVVHLDAGLRMLKTSHYRGSARAEIALPLRCIVREALLLGSATLILAHNHPSGDPEPSRADKLATRRLVDIARPLEIGVLDHLIFAGERWYSFRAGGLL